MQVSSLSDALVALYAKNHSNSVKVHAFSVNMDQGILAPAASVWLRFLQDLPQNRPGSLTILLQCRRAVTVLLAEAWVKNFIREPPRYSASEALSLLQKDEDAIQVLGKSPELESFLLVFAALRTLLRRAAQHGKVEWEDLTRAETQFQELLGEDTGRSLAQALWQAVNR